MKTTSLDYLKKLDLTENEANLYIKLLETGPLDVKSLSTILQTKRTTIYNYLDTLRDKGLVIKHIYKSRTILSATNPEDILPYLVEQKVKDGKSLQDSLPTILQKFKFSPENNDAISQSEITVYKGKNGVRKIYKEALESKEIRSFVNMEDIERVFPENFKLFDDAFKNNPEIIMYEIIEDSPLAKEKSEISTENENERYHCKYFPKKRKIASTDILIYDGNVSFINLKGAVDGVILRNNHLYENFKFLFESMWEMLPDNVTVENEN